MNNELRRLDHGVIDLSQFREKKNQPEPIVPFFTEPTIVTLADAEKPDSTLQYLLLINLVHNDKQFIALESMQKEDLHDVMIVEALIEDGAFAGVQPVSTQEEYEHVVSIVMEALTSEEEAGDSHDPVD